MVAVKNVALIALWVLLLGTGCYGPVRTATIGKREFATKTWAEANHPYLMPITAPAGALYDTVVFSLDTTFMLTANMVWRPMFETYPEPLKPEWPALAVYAISPLAVAAVPVVLLNPLPLLDETHPFVNTNVQKNSELERFVGAVVAMPVGWCLYPLMLTAPSEGGEFKEFRKVLNGRLKEAGICFGTLPIVGLPYHGYRIAETWDKYEKIFGHHYLGPNWKDKQERERQKKILALHLKRQQRENNFKTKLRNTLSLNDRCKLLQEAKAEFGKFSWWLAEKERACCEIEKKIDVLFDVCSYEESQKVWSELGMDMVMENVARHKRVFGFAYSYRGLLLPITFDAFPWASIIKEKLLKKWNDIDIELSRAMSLDDVKETLQKYDYQMVIEQGERYGIDVNQLKEEVSVYQIIAELKDAIKSGNESRVKEICAQRTRITKPVNVDFLTEKIVNLKPETINSLLENNWLSYSTLSKFFELNYGLIYSRVKSLLAYTHEVSGKTPLAKIVLKTSRKGCDLRDFDAKDAMLVKYCLLNDKIDIDDLDDVLFARERWEKEGIDEIVLVRLLESGRGRIVTKSQNIDRLLFEINNTYTYITTLWNGNSSLIESVILSEQIEDDVSRLIQAKVLGDICRDKQNFKDAQQWYRKCWKFAKRNFQVVDDAKTELITLYSKGEIILPIEEAEQLYNYHPEQKAYKERREFAEVLNEVLGKRESLKDEYLKMLLKMEIVKEEKLVDQRLSSSLWALIYQYKPSFFVENDGLKNERFKGELFLEANPNNFVGLATCCLLYGKVEKIKIVASAVKERFPNEKKDDKPEPLVSFHLWLKDAYKLRRLLDGFKSATDLSAIGQFYINLIDQKDNHDTEPLVYALEKIFKEQKWGVDSLDLFKTYCRMLEENGRQRIREHIKANYPQKSERALTALGISEKGENSQSE